MSLENIRKAEPSQITAAEPGNSLYEELNDGELDAIAGGIRTITVTGPAPTYTKPRISMQLINYLRSYSR